MASNDDEKTKQIKEYVKMRKENRKREAIEKMLESLDENELSACKSLSAMFYKASKKQPPLGLGTLVKIKGGRSAYKVIEIRDKKYYKLQSANHTRVKGLFVRDQLEQADQITWNGETVYSVEKILGHRTVKGGKNEFLVKWASYPVEEATWEPEKNFVDRHLLFEYMQNNEN